MNKVSKTSLYVCVYVGGHKTFEPIGQVKYAHVSLSVTKTNIIHIRIPLIDIELAGDISALVCRSLDT